MEILAIYVEDFFCFKNYTINLSPDYDIKILKVGDKDFNCNIHKKKRSFNIFEKDFGKVTALIGENGSGKSTVAKLLRLIASYNKSSSIILIVYIDEEGIKIRQQLGHGILPEYLSKENKIKLTCNDVNVKDQSEITTNFFDENHTKLIYFSSLFSYSQENWLDTSNSSTSLINISVDYTLRETLTYSKVREKIETGEKISSNNKYFDITKQYYLEQ